MLASLLKGKIDLGDGTAGKSLPTPKEIKFELNDKVKQYIADAEQNFDKLVGAHTLVVRFFFYFFSFLSLIAVCLRYFWH